MWWPLRRRQVDFSILGPDDLGRLGEKLASKHLRRLGLKILGANYRCPAGEADLIALDPSTRTSGAQTIVFVEVKTRASDRYTNPEAAVDSAKQDHMRRIATYYLAGRNAQGFNLRFDIISIVLTTGQEPKVKHIVDAF